jgi:hypothetical protein
MSVADLDGAVVAVLVIVAICGMAGEATVGYLRIPKTEPGSLTADPETMVGTTAKTAAAKVSVVAFATDDAIKRLREPRTSRPIGVLAMQRRENDFG